MLERLRRRQAAQEGFTLIELLVVVIIVGILAAIAIPSFLGQRDKANDAAAKSLVRNEAVAVEAAFTDTQDYTLIDSVKLIAIEPNISIASTAAGALAASNSVFYVSSAAKAFSLSSISKNNTTYTYSKAATGVVSRSCSPTTACTDASGVAGRW